MPPYRTRDDLFHTEHEELAFDSVPPALIDLVLEKANGYIKQVADLGVELDAIDTRYPRNVLDLRDAEHGLRGLFHRYVNQYNAIVRDYKRADRDKLIETEKELAIELGADLEQFRPPAPAQQELDNLFVAAQSVGSEYNAREVKAEVGREEYEALLKLYRSFEDARVGAPRPVYTSQWNDKTVTVLWDRSEPQGNTLGLAELVPEDQYSGETYTLDKLYQRRDMGLADRRDNRGLLVSDRGQTYVVATEYVIADRDSFTRATEQTHESGDAEYKPREVKAVVGEVDFKALEKLYSANLDAKPGEPKPVRIGQWDGKTVTVFWGSFGPSGEEVGIAELTPLEQYKGETYTHDVLRKMWDMDLGDRGDNRGLLVLARGRIYVVTTQYAVANRDALERAAARDQQESEEPDLDDELEPELLAQEVAPATVSEAVQAAEPTLNNDYKEGDRVVIESTYVDDLKGRHGEVLSKREVVSQLVTLVSQRRTEERHVSYEVKTDAGTITTVGHDSLAAEVGLAPVVNLDPVVNGTAHTPKHVHQLIDYYRKEAGRNEGYAARARKPERRAAYQREADAKREQGKEYQAAWAAWAAQYPEAAAEIAGPLAQPAPAHLTAGAEVRPDWVRVATFKHTKTGEQKITVNLVDRVERDVFTQIRAVAGQLGGHWSSYGRDGAIPGFLFDSDEAVTKWLERVAPMIGQTLETPAAENVREADQEAAAVDAEPEAASAPVVPSEPEAEPEPAPADEYCLSRTESEELYAYFLKRYGDSEPIRLEAFASMLRRAEDGVVTERGSTDAFKDPVKWAKDWMVIERAEAQARIADPEEDQDHDVPAPAPVEQGEAMPPQAESEMLLDAIATADTAEEVRQIIDDADTRFLAGDLQMEPSDWEQVTEAVQAKFGPEPDDEVATPEKYLDVRIAAILDIGPDGLLGQARTMDAAPFVEKWRFAYETAAMDLTYQGVPEEEIDTLYEYAGDPDWVVEQAKAYQAKHAVERELVQRQRAAVLAAGDPSIERPSGKGMEVDVVPVRDRKTMGEPESEPVDFQIREDEGNETGGLRRKCNDNLEAIRLLKQLEEAGSRASADDQAILAKYVGWGGLKGVFNEENVEWAKERSALKRLLSDTEYAAARRSQLDAHYTTKAVVGAVYSGFKRMGFTGGRFIEPAIGIGNFVGQMPVEMRANSHVFGVELDLITGRIAKQLYPKAEIVAGKGYQQVSIPSGAFDAAAGNPPFGNQMVFDAEHPEFAKMSLHNYFFAKTVDKLRPGGLFGMVVSRYFLDAQDSATREWIAERAELVGAYRLPNTAFLKNANTEVVSDIVFLRRLQEGETADRIWVNTVEKVIEDGRTADEENNKAVVNQYFLDHPAHVLGIEALESSQYRSHDYTVNPIPGWEKDLKALIETTLPKDIYIPGKPVEQWVDVEAIMPPNVKAGSYFKGTDGQVYRRLSDQFDKPRAVPAEFQTVAAAARVEGMIVVREALRDLMRAEMSDDSSDAQLSVLRSRLNARYDAFRKKHGFLNSLANRRAFADDPDLPLMESLEPDYDPGISKEVAKKNQVEARPATARRADIFSKRVLMPVKVPNQAESAKDALVASLNYRGRVDLDFMAGLYGKDTAEITDELSGLVYEDPDRGWVTSEEYLSGNVKAKLARAMDAAEGNPKFMGNVRALEEVQPKDIPPLDISVRLGTAWVPPHVIEDFARELWAPRSISVQYLKAVAQWKVDSSGGDEIAMKTKWGTSEIPAPGILVALLGNKGIEVRHNHGTAREPRWVVDEKETEAARAKASEMAQQFKDWIWKDPDRAEKLARLYNDQFNTTRTRTYDGSHLTLPGANPVIKLRPNQLNAIWRGVTERVILLDQVVGAGKTYTKIGMAMEMRRLGILKKPILGVPNHLVRQWRDAFYALYPGGNVLAATEADFEMDNRRKLFAKIATGDWDAVIVGHSSLKKIGLPRETEGAVLGEMLEDISDAIETLKRERGDKNVARDMEKIKDNLKARMDRLNSTAGTRDEVVTFDELGVDGLFVDELHEFKNLFFTTTMQQVAGLGSPAGSGKAFDLFVKRRWLVERYGEQAVFVGATGTPVSNSLVEMFTMQRYMQYDELRRKGIHLLDAWAGAFGDVQNVYEVHPSGSGYRMSTRFAKFVNMPELMAMYRSFADIVTMDDLKAQAAAQGLRFPVPNVAGGKPQNLVAPRSPMQERFFGVPEFVRKPEEDELRSILFKLEREPGDIRFDQAEDGLWYVAGDMSSAQVRKTGNYATREECVAEVIQDYLTPKAEWNENSILWKYERLAELTKRTNGKINALSITNEARKAGLDYRLIDPAAPDFAQSKINMAADEIVRIYHKWNEDRGTQLVFCDLSVPLGEKERMGGQERRAYVRDENGELKQVKATTHTVPDVEDYPFYVVRRGKQFVSYDAITGAQLPTMATAKRSDQVNAVLGRCEIGLEWIDRVRAEVSPIGDDEIDRWKAQNQQQENAGGEEQEEAVTLVDLLAISGKTKFSVYDDLKQKLIERGIPADEIAFIHDYDTSKKKAELFRDINDGRKRVTIGSTPKMGAGTNVQERIVGLHHLDCPWRPSDLEQREGRGIRQGNMLYERDPDGFELEVLRYATMQTYDTRMWQIVEHKARGVEQLRRAGSDVREIDDLGGEAASSADMKAAASGNPLILEEIKLRNQVKSLEAQRDVWLSSRYQLTRELKWLKDAPQREAEERARYEPLIALRDANKTEEVAVKIQGKVYTDRAAIGEYFKNRMVAALKSKHGELVELCEYRGFRYEMERDKAGVLVLCHAEGKSRRMQCTWYDEKDQFSASGLLQRMNNHLSGFDEKLRDAIADARKCAQQIPSVEEELANPFTKEAELVEKRREHHETTTKLRRAGGEIRLTDEMRAELSAILPARVAELEKAGFAVDQEIVRGILGDQTVQNASIEHAPAHVERSLRQAHEAIEQNGGVLVATNKDSGRYAGEILFVTDHHVVQDLGRRERVVHHVADVDGPIEVGKAAQIVYQGGRGQVKTGREPQLANSR